MGAYIPPTLMLILELFIATHKFSPIPLSLATIVHTFFNSLRTKEFVPEEFGVPEACQRNLATCSERVFFYLSVYQITATLHTYKTGKQNTDKNSKTGRMHSIPSLPKKITLNR